MMLAAIIEVLKGAYSGQAAKEDVAAISRFHRIQASPGYRQAADYVFNELKKAGLQAEVERYPADYESRFYTSRSFQEWDAKGATLHLVEPEDEAQLLADFRAQKLSLIQRSASFQGDVELVLLEDGLKEEDYEGVDVTGKVVLTRGAVGRVRQLAVERFGAVGILFDGMSKTPPVREPMDLPDDRQYTSFWWSGKEKACFGFVLSPRQGNMLRELHRRRAASGKGAIRLRAWVESSFHNGDIEVVTALIPGQSQETALLVSHLCHPQPSANDNASGAAANLEAARALRRLIDSGELPRPQRSIRFLWMPEMTGSYAYLARHEDEISSMIAGLNLDMVGEDQRQCGSVLLLERPPDAAASFAPDLVEGAREIMLSDVKSYSGLGSYSTTHSATTGFSGGSDHYIFSDPTVGVPMPMLIQWPDKFYHTSADTLDKVSPTSLAQSGIMAAAFAFFVASAGESETTWLAHEMLTRFRTRLARLVQDHVGRLSEVGDTTACRRMLAALPPIVAYHLDRHRAALDTLERLSAGARPVIEEVYEAAVRFAGDEQTRGVELGRQLAGMPGSITLTGEERELDNWERRAAGLRPRRHYRGPFSFIGGLADLPEKDKLAWQSFLDGRSDGAYVVATLAEYWADGRRTALEIADLVEMETGLRDVELIVRRFELLEKLNLVELG